MQQFDVDAVRRSPSQRQLRPPHDRGGVDGHEGVAASPRGASRQVRSRQVSSSFENLVGGLLAAPLSHTQCRRHLANSAETPAVGDAVLAWWSSSINDTGVESICGRGADVFPALAAFVEPTTTPAAPAGVGGSRTSSLVPVLPRHNTKHALHQVRRAKQLLFKSCVQRRRSDDAAK